MNFRAAEVGGGSGVSTQSSYNFSFLLHLERIETTQILSKSQNNVINLPTPCALTFGY